MKARLIVTTHCNMKCKGCCNGPVLPSAKKIGSVIDFNDLSEHDMNLPTELILTGGEPLVSAKSRAATLDSAMASCRIHTIKDVWLYTASWHRDLDYILPYLSGVTFTIHYDPRNDMAVQAMSNTLHEYRYRFGHRHQLHNRLRIDSRVPPHFVDMYSKMGCTVFEEVKIFDWIDSGECPLPHDEQLFILKEAMI